MSEQSTVFPDSIDEVLTAVQETPRGRWFLEAYSNRIKSDGNANILQAIKRLENTLTSMAIGGADTNLLQQTREAIAAAKREIAAMEPKSELSAEGQLFAKLAEMSKSAFQSNPAAGTTIVQGVDRVLKLVSEIDHKLSDQLTAQEAALAKPALHYFKQDEEIFEPAPVPVIAVGKKTETADEVPSRGAKLVIQRISKSEPHVETEMPAAAEMQDEAQKAPMSVTSPEPAAKTNTESRIVIIRRKAEDMTEVPLMDEPSAESLTAA